MSVKEDSEVDKLSECLENVDLKEDKDKEHKKKETDDDGYSSANSEDSSKQEKIKDTKPELDLEDEEILQPLSFFREVDTPVVTIISRGPVTLDQHSNRFQPYGRPQIHGPASGPPPPVGRQHVGEDFGDQEAPKPNIMIFKKADPKNPTKLDIGVTWSNKYELAIERHLLPQDTYYGEEPISDKVQLFIQLNPRIQELKSFLADVRTELDADGQKKLNFIGPIVISLKTELADSQEKYLLEKTTMEERTAAFNLVNQKELAQLTSGIGPHKDTVLSVLCAQRNPPNPGQTYAQIHAVIQRLVKNTDKTVRDTVFRLNANQISAFEIAAITNNSVVACYLAEVWYNLTDDTRSALRILNCRDTQGNTILHLLARKGDSNKVTIKALLDMHLTDGTKLFNSTANSKKQFPMHIATQNVKNQPETIRILYENRPRSFEMLDDDGMSALHYACQRTTDVELVRTVLSYKKDNINLKNKDGLTAYDLISRRSEVTTQTQGKFAIEKAQQNEIIQLIRNNGGRSSTINNETPNQSNGAAIPAIVSDYTHNAGYYHAQNSNTTSSPPQCESPNGQFSPYAYSINTSPRTPSVGSPSSFMNPPSMDSQGSFPQPSSPDSNFQGSPGHGHHYSYQHQFNPDSPNSENSQLSYEDQIASQILTQFPEIGHILDQNN